MELDQGLLKGIHDVLFYVVFHFSRAVLAFMQRESYLYWPFLLSTVLIAGFVARAGVKSPAGFFSPKLWWHPSARADYRLYLANALLFPLLLAPLLLTNGQISTAMNSALGIGSSAGMEGSESVFALRVLFTVVFFVAYDLGRFIAHSLLHDVPALWEFHKVHHSAAVLTPMTAYRAHPVELLLMAWVPALLTGLTTWLFSVAGAQVGFFSFLGLHVAIWAFNLVDNLRHSPTWLSYGRRPGKWLISPAHHQLHHSYEPRHMGCNRGSNLAIWDRLYGTLYVPSGPPEAFRMGLGDQSDAHWNGVGRMYAWPIMNCIGMARGRFGKAGTSVRPAWVQAKGQVSLAVDESV